MKRKNRFPDFQLMVLAFLLLTVSACIPHPGVSPFEFIPSNHTVPITYQPSGHVNNVQSKFKVGKVMVLDERNAGADWLGSIRGGYGNPVKRLFTEGDTATIVRGVFESALKMRNLYTEESSSRFQLNISLTKFDTNYYFNKEAHAHFTVNLVDNITSKTVYSKFYRADKNRAGSGEGVKASVSDLAKFANETLNETIDKALDEPEFLSILQVTSLLVL